MTLLVYLRVDLCWRAGVPAHTAKSRECVQRGGPRKLLFWGGGVCNHPQRMRLREVSGNGVWRAEGAAQPELGIKAEPSGPGLAQE